MHTKKKITYINIFAVTLVLIVTALIFIYFSRSDKTVAATGDQIEITIDKVTTVSIYAFGPGVELVESTNDYDKYNADINTTVRLQAVNETRIFTGWVLSKTDSSSEKEVPSVDNLNKNIINVPISESTADLSVTVTRRDATSSDYGKYMMDRFVIAGEQDLIALQNILAGSNDDSDFELYFDDPTVYNSNEKKNTLREELRYGYFLISNNFTVFNEAFTGLGTKSSPFQGIMCGQNVKNSKLFITITDEEQVGESSYGLFKYLGNEAVIRNLIVSTSIGITKYNNSTNTESTIYAGGLAGVMDRSTLIDVVVSSSIGIDSNIANNIYSGGICGKLEKGTGIDSISDVIYEGTESKWSVVSHKEGSNIHAGFIAGSATDAYIKEADVVVTNQIVDLKNDAVDDAYSNSNLYLGNIFGSYFIDDLDITIDDLMIMGTALESMRAVTSNGDAVVGGLIGYVNKFENNSAGSLNLGKTYFRVLGGESEYYASSLTTDNVTNLYAGGIVGYIESGNVIATDAFKNRLELVDLGGGDYINSANYLFEGEYNIKTIQNGQSIATSNGKAISGGLVGKGYIDFNGENNLERSTLAIASVTSKLNIEAVQSKLSTTNGSLNDKEHASAALIYGSVGDNALNVANINVYTNNTTIRTVREIGSFAIGDLHSGGFISYAKGSTFENIGLHFNNSLIKAESLSFEAVNTNTDTNSAFCGGFAGELVGNSSLSNIVFSGYDDFSFESIGTTSNLESIQNTIPGKGDYKGENYLGGMVGRIKHTAINGCKFIGSDSFKNYIRMSGHESPDSAFCGGIVGLIQTNQYNIPSAVTNCNVANTDISGNATCVDYYANPDIYIGGIVGGAYIHSTNSTVTIANCTLTNSTVNALGNEIIATYAAGIIAGATWESSLSISDCYVVDSIIKSNTSTTKNPSVVIESSSAGILGMAGNGTSVTISNCVVIDTTVDAKVDATFANISSYAAGISGYTESNSNVPSIRNCYSNALVTSSHLNNNATQNAYGICYNGNFPYNNYSYYVSKNVSDPANNLGVALSSGPFEITNVARNPYRNYNGLNSTNGQGQKLYVELLGDDTLFTVNNSKNNVLSISSSGDDAALAHIWINAKNGGGLDGSGNLIIPDHEDKVTAAANGWFILDYVLLYSGSIDDISSDLSNLDSSYLDENTKYEHFYQDITGDDISDHYLENVKNPSDKITKNYQEEDVIDGVKEFTFNIYDDMLSLSLDFEITHYSSNYHLVFKDSLGNVINDTNFKNLYGDINLKLVEKHSTALADKYNLLFAPNENLENDSTIYVYFVAGNNDVTAETCLKINLIANKLQLVGVTYSDYTPPLNYFEDDLVLGTNSLPYQLCVNSITKFVPIFTKSNDLVVGKKYISEEFIEKCNYSINQQTDQYFDIFTNGELKTLTTANQNGQLTVSYQSDSITVYFVSCKEITVSYDVVGADISGLTKATDTTDFYFEQVIRSSYSGIPSSFIVTIGSTNYDLTSNPNSNANITLYFLEQNGEIGDSVSEYDSNAYGYAVRVNESLLTSDNVSIHITYPVVYTVTFKLQCETFNPSIPSNELTRTYKIVSGAKFKEFFQTDIGGKTIKEDILDWAENAKIFGFVFTGFYLVNDANSIQSYGLGFEELCESDYIVNSSNTFYGRWSYLIELVEVSGTYIKTGFNSSFMQEYIGDGFNRAIQIPINANQGYVFRIDTDPHYMGEVGVEAYSVTINNLDEKVMTEVPISYYQNNNNLYFIDPSDINGYLVIMTTVSNSEVIVGEHTSSITENITPEDGIITFKYIVNHYNDGNNKSYIYNLLNNGLVDHNYYQSLNKEFVLDFYKESDHSDLSLPDYTEIRVYYNSYVNGSTTPNNTIVGTYITNNDDRVYLTEFKKLDLETNAFSDTKTYGSSLDGYTSVTEVYYFTIIPPNGYSEKVKNEIANYVVECGYVYEKVGRGEEINYLQGLRSEKVLANPNDLNDVVNSSKAYESSRQDKTYHIIPSRLTDLTDNGDDSYTFIDKVSYDLYDITLTDTQKLPDFNYISLYDDHRDSILESSVMNFSIKELRLTLGYRLGNVIIYGKGKENSDSWEKVAEINVSQAIYQEYKVDFKDSEGNYKYYAYKIDNVSTNEIRLTKMDVLSNVNGVLYEGNIDYLIEKSSGGNIHSYSFSNPIIGDSRHDGKIFMLAIQLVDKTNPSNIINNIDGDIFIDILDIGLGIEHYVYLNEYLGKTTAFINLSEIMKTLNVETFDFTINIPDDYVIHELQLLEVTNEFKPASGEVRVKYTTEHTHYFVDGVCRCGEVDPNYYPLLNEFAQMLVNDFNTAGGNNVTKIFDFYNTSGNNIKSAWTNATMLHKYRWFLEYIKAEITANATANNALTDDAYLNTIELLNNMISGPNPETIFTRGDYTVGSQVIRHFIMGLINMKSPSYIGVPEAYYKFMTDYANHDDIVEFINLYQNSKTDIQLAKYNNGGLVSGGFTWNNAVTPTINVNYLCTSAITSTNSLVGQSKILLQKVTTGVYKVVAVANSGKKANDVATDAGVTWTHAIATAYPVDYVSLYSKYLNKYLLIDESTMPSLTTNTSVADYNSMVDLTWNQYFSGTFADSYDFVGWSGDPIRTFDIVKYTNIGSNTESIYTKAYLCNTSVVGNYNSLQYQNKLLLEYDAEKDAFLVVAKNTMADNIGANSLASSLGVTWTHAIASTKLSVSTYANVGQYIVFEGYTGTLDVDANFTAKVYNASQWN